MKNLFFREINYVNMLLNSFYLFQYFLDKFFSNFYRFFVRKIVKIFCYFLVSVFAFIFFNCNEEENPNNASDEKLSDKKLKVSGNLTVTPENRTIRSGKTTTYQIDFTKTKPFSEEDFDKDAFSEKSITNSFSAALKDNNLKDITLPSGLKWILEKIENEDFKISLKITTTAETSLSTKNFKLVFTAKENSSFEGSIEGNFSLTVIREQPFINVKGTKDLSSLQIRRIDFGNDKLGNGVLFAMSEDKVYAIELENSDTIVNNIGEAFGGSGASAGDQKFITDLKAVSGNNNIKPLQVVVNSLTKQIYILANDKKLYKVTVSGGVKSVVAVDLSSVKAVEITLPKIKAADKITRPISLAWSKTEETLYISFGSGTSISFREKGIYQGWGAVSLTSAITWIKGALSKDISDISEKFRNTKFTTSNPFTSSANYITSAPVQIITVGVVDGNPFLSGQNTCSPGFSLKTSDLKASTEEITFVQTFNMDGDIPYSLFYQLVGGVQYLFSFSDRGLYRIGKEFFDGRYNIADGPNSDRKVKILGGFGNTLKVEQFKKYTFTEGTPVSVFPYQEEGKVLILYYRNNYFLKSFDLN